MASTPAKKTPAKKTTPVPATIVGAAPNAQPIPAHIVADDRDFFGKRLAIVAFAALVLYFLISSLIQSSSNGEKLDRADKNRSDLIASVAGLSNTLDANTRLISQLQAAIRAQNAALRAAGIDPVPVPGVTAPDTSTSDNNLSTGRGSPNNPDQRGSVNPAPQPGTSPSPRPNPGPSPKPGPKPSPGPHPSPTPTPVVPAGELICNLVGICLN